MIRILLITTLAIIDFSQAFGQVNVSSMANDRTQSTTQYVPRPLGTGEKFNDPKFFEVVKDSKFVVPKSKLPSIRTQDGTDHCQTFCSLALTESEYCKQESFNDCQTVLDEKRLAATSMLIYRKSVSDNELGAIGSFTESDDFAAYEILNKISSLTGPPFFYSESCLPFEKFVAQEKFKGNYFALKSFFSNLEISYETAKKNPKATEAATISNCEECVALMTELNSTFSLTLSLEDIQKSLSSKKFSIFLYNTLLVSNRKSNPNCTQFRLKKKISFDHFPIVDDSENAKPTTLKDGRKFLEDKIKEEKPVLVSGVCVAWTAVDDKKCLNHCVVVTGVKQVRNLATNEIVDVVQINNSAGKKWQSENADGWIRASSLYDKILTDDDRSAIKKFDEKAKMFANTFSWSK